MRLTFAADANLCFKCLNYLPNFEGHVNNVFKLAFFPDPPFQGRWDSDPRDSATAGKRQADTPWKFYTGVCVMEMLVNSQEASLLSAFRRLPPDAAMELSRLIERLATLAPDRKINWSDSWSDEDLKEFRDASVRRLDAADSEEMG